MNTSPATTDRDDGWEMTLAFWGVLLVAGGLFAAASLAPRLKALAELKAEYATNQLRLVELERRAIELEQVAEALESDPAFAAELAKLEFDAGRAGDERIAVPEELRLGAATGGAADAFELPVKGWSVPSALLDPLATHVGLRRALLGIAAALALGAFLVLNEGQAAWVRGVAGRVKRVGRRWVGRYRKA